MGTRTTQCNVRIFFNVPWCIFASHDARSLLKVSDGLLLSLHWLRSEDVPVFALVEV